jgi:hypothetical protein
MAQSQVPTAADNLARRGGPECGSLSFTASAIASASMKSFLFDFTKGFTNWAGISRTSWPLLMQRPAEEVGAGARLQAD